MKYSIFLLAGRDAERREIMKKLDPEGKYISKVLLPMHHKTVLEWVVEEYLQSPFVEEIIIIGLSEEDIKIEGPVNFIPMNPFTPLSKKYLAALEYLEKNNKFTDKIILGSSDCPGVKVETLNTFIRAIEKKDGYDFILSVIPFETVEAAFPDSKRGVARLKDYSITQGELACFSPRAIRDYQKEINHFTGDLRKKRSFWSLVGYVARRPRAWYRLFKIVIGKGTLQDAIIGFSKAFKLKADVVIIEDAGLSLDMDLPQDYERLTHYVKKLKINAK